MCHSPGSTAEYGSSEVRSKDLKVRLEGLEFAVCCLVPKLELSFHSAHAAINITEEAERCQQPEQWLSMAEGEAGSGLHLNWSDRVPLPKTR